MDEYAIIEQMGHRRFGARIREVDFCGVKPLEATTLTEPPLTQRIHPQSLYALTGCTEEQARSACGRWSLPSDLKRMLPEPEEPSKPPAEEPEDAPDAGERALHAVVAQRAAHLLSEHLLSGGYRAAAHLVTYGIRGAAHPIALDLEQAQGAAREGVDRSAGWHAMTAAQVLAWGRGDDSAVLTSLAVLMRRGCAGCATATLYRRDDRGRCATCQWAEVRS